MKGGRRSWKPVERPLAAADDVDAAALMTAQREYHKTGTGLIKSTFEPQRHTWFVAGRPFQVLHEIICRARHNVVNVFAPAPCVCAAVCVCLCVRVCVCVCVHVSFHVRADVHSQFPAASAMMAALHDYSSTNIRQAG